MDIPNGLLASVYNFLLGCGFVKTSKLFIKEIRKKNLFLQEEKKESLIELYYYYIEEKKGEKDPSVQKILPQVKSPKKISKKKKEKLFKEKIEDKRKRSPSSDHGLSVKKIKKHKKDHLKSQAQTEALNTSFAQKEDKIYSNGTEVIDTDKEVTINSKTYNENDSKNVDEIEEQKKGEPFSRIDKSKVEFAGECFKDNSYAMAYKDESGEYGEKANRDLMAVKGKEFRTEKSKKKKGSYHGGRINANISRSFKFA
ncbi:hypothetical protein PORY_001672 [Pneumocystis oryctolagi]|uniref:Uncharacterized protein n=1 Tax=Pneumocystis oryctolagi TaxID=42067 RepID=A0ACB7CB86_9ASCO|nr:hypothetical protein PORY_001672 [Pneumocystis oryctolagi]